VLVPVSTERSAHDALQVVIDEAWRGRRWVVETNIANFSSAIPHEKLMQPIEERVCDQAVLLRAMLRAAVMNDGAVRREVTGTHSVGRIRLAREHGIWSGSPMMPW
jgi:RNA-directed DNA polymerase